MKMDNRDKKGLIWFIALTFIPTYILEFLLMANGFSFADKPEFIAQCMILIAMFFPGIAALIVRVFITNEGFADAGFRLGHFKHYIHILLLTPILFIIVYGMTSVFGQQPDFTLKSFADQYGLTLPIPAVWMILIFSLLSITIAPVSNTIPAFGEEFGWRGYLLPKLLPLGQTKALVLSGIIWGLWHAPLVLMGFHYGKYGLAGVFFFTVLIMFIGIYFGYLRIISGSTIIPAFAHGVFNAQFYGVWTLLYPNINPLRAGITGIPGITVFAILGIWVLYVLRNNRKSAVSAKASAIRKRNLS